MEIQHKTPLHDVAFLLIARFDTIVRLENTVHVARYLNDNFETNIHLWECDSFYNGFLRKLLPSNVHYAFREDHDPILHRTRYINQMVRSVEVPYVSVWDVDVVAQPSQIVKAVELLRQGTDFVYPYEKYFLDTSAVLRREYLKHGDLKVLQDYWRFMKEMYPPNPVGGAFLANRESYIRSGLENRRRRTLCAVEKHGICDRKDRRTNFPFVASKGHQQCHPSSSLFCG